jgi:hypothetical protein
MKAGAGHQANVDLRQTDGVLAMKLMDNAEERAACSGAPNATHKIAPDA